MTRQEFVENIKQSHRDGENLIDKKNSDYAKAEDPFANFRQAANVAGVSVERAILVRIGDKLGRVENLLEQDPNVAGETIEDTLLDASNYILILKAFLDSKYEVPDVEEDEDVKAAKIANSLPPVSTAGVWEPNSPTAPTRKTLADFFKVR